MHPSAANQDYKIIELTAMMYPPTGNVRNDHCSFPPAIADELVKGGYARHLPEETAQCKINEAENAKAKVELEHTQARAAAAMNLTPQQWIAAQKAGNDAAKAGK